MSDERKEQATADGKNLVARPPCVCGHARKDHFAEPEGDDCRRCGCDRYRPIVRREGDTA